MMSRLIASLFVRRSLGTLLVVALLFSSASSVASDVIVTQADDAPPGEPLIFGSLRDAIKNRASAGDRIVFNVKGPVRLRDDLTIPRDLANLTIQGKVTIRPAGRAPGVVIVEGDNVSINDVTFHNFSLLVLDSQGGIPRRIQGFNLSNSRFRQDAQIDINYVDICSVTDNAIVTSADEPQAAALATYQTSGCVLARNQINATRSGTAAIYDESSSDFRAHNNTVDKGDVYVRAVSGEVRENNIGGRIHALRPDFGVANALLTIEDNTADSILANRTFISLIHNTLDGSTPGIGGTQSALIMENDDPAGPQGPILIERNIITGGRNGISYSETLRGAPAVIHDNHISGCEIRGILVNSGQEVQVTENEVKLCGSGGTGRGIAIGRAGGGGVIVEDNTVSEIDGTGFLVLPQTTGNSVLLKDNTSIGNTRTGIFMSANTSDLFGLIRMENNTVTGNGDAGIVAQPGSRGLVIGGEIKDNRASGVRINTDARLSVSQVSMGANDGPGIDIAPEGVTPNAETKNGNSDIDWPENVSISPVSQKLEGTAAPGSIVEIFVVEAGERLGNPENGEGLTFLGSATATADGSFVYPANGAIQCPETRLITLTATLDDGEAVTSEFSTDFDCVIPDDPPPVTDDDGDGVGNAADQCPDTPAGEPADENGCAESQKDDDGDGVSNAADQCPATPPGEGTNSNGCGESQLDDDGDGVSNAEDRCTAPGNPANSGCPGLIVIPGLGIVYLNDLAQSTIEFGQVGENCFDCLIELEDDTAHSCFGSGSFAISDTRAISSSSCDYEAPALVIDGNGAVITSAVDESVACEGSVGECSVTADNESLSGACSATSCARWFGASLLDGSSADATRTVVAKTSIGDDGTFSLLGRTTAGEYPYFWQVTTVDGVGNKIVELFFGSDTSLILEEIDYSQWSESVLCSNTPSGQQLGGTTNVVVNSIVAESFTTWNCEFENTVIVDTDTDGDGVPDSEDRCSNPGTGGNECPEQGDNGSAAWYCNNALTCSFTPTEGDCSDCIIERYDQSASIACAPGGVCVLRNDRVLECPAGGCDYVTPNVTGSCAPGSLCTHDIGFSCQTDAAGNGCDGIFASTGESIACPAAQVCEIEVTPNLLTEAASLTAVVDFLKNTEGGDGSFDFDWTYNSTVVFATGLDMYEGQFSIATQAGAGESIARFYVEPVLGDITVAERASGNFVLNRVDCDPVSGVEALSEAELEEDQVGGVVVRGQHACTFVNVLEAAQPDRVSQIPDGMVQPDGVGNITPNAFAGQLNTTNPVVGIGTGSSEIFVDVVTGEVPRAGNDRLSFTGTGFASFGVLVQPNDASPGSDTVRSSGAGTVSYTFDPNTGTFGFGVIGFNTIIDLLHLGNDNTSSALLSVSLNQIDVLSPPASTGLDGINRFTVTTPEHLNNVTGQLVSAQAYSLGRLDRFNPCQESGQPMPAGCSAEIDAVIATPGFEFCADFWTPSCASEYSSQNDNFCALPFDQRQVSFGGNLLVLTDGTPGQIHLGNPALDFFGRVDTIGDVGNDPRRVRCLAGICAVSNNGSDSLTILTWDGGQNAAITDTATVGDGPIGVDLRQFGDNVVILSTGSNNDTYTKTTVSPSGLVTSSETLPILSGCAGPGHIIWVDNSTKAFATCFTSDSYAVFEP